MEYAGVSVSEAETSFLGGIVDALCILLGVIISCWYYRQDWDYSWSFIAVCGVAIYYFIAQRSHIYRSWRIVALRHELMQVWMVWSIASVAVLLVALFNEPFHDSSHVLATWYAATLFMLFMWRVSIYLVLWEASRHGYNTRRVAIVGQNLLGVSLAETLECAKWKGFELSGFYDDRRSQHGRTVMPVVGKVCGDMDDLVAHAREGRIDLIYITLPMRAEERMRSIIERLADSTISVYVVPGNFTYDLLRPQLTAMGEMPVIGVCETPFYGVGGFIKRAEDLLLGGILLAIALFPMLVIAAGIKLTSPGPVLFKQRRGGVNGEIIKVWKFRTMTVCEDGDQVEQVQRDDARVTPFGALLRRTSLDELPQIINVLQGTMSIVGPRPHAIMHNSYYRPLIHRYMLRHKVKPGLTGWAQINGWRGETEVLTKMEKRIEFDLHYINNWSLLLDLKIVMLTPLILLRNKNVY